MCGIVGLYNWHEPTEVVSDHLKRMCRSIVHRGPDDEGFYLARGIGLGMRRLSIIDVAGGHQPISNEDGTVTVVFNGEIYNYRELREMLTRRGHRFQTQTDTEVIVHAYEEDGADCIKQFNGIFAFALWDAQVGRLVVARDRMGVKPLYYAHTPQGFALASEVKALLTIPDVPRVIDPEAAAQFFRLGFTIPPHTLFGGIHKLPAGWRLVAERGTIHLQKYWDLDFVRLDIEPTFDECCEELRAVLWKAVTSQMVSDVPLGAFLSGGVDSTAVVAFMRQAATNGVRTYSIGFDAQYAYHNEAPFAEAAARALGTEHRTLIVRPHVADLLPNLVEMLDEPLTDTSFLLSYLVSELASRDVKVVLSGLGGDELFGGYRRYLAPSLNRLVAWIPENVRRSIGRLLDHGLRADRGTVWGNFGRYGKAWGRTSALPMAQQYVGLLSVLSVELVNTLLNRPAPSSDPGGDLIEIYDRVGAETVLDRLMYVDAKTVLPESLLLLTDKMGMANSLEVRVPFLDNQVVDFVRRVPAHYRMRGWTLKRLLKAALKGVVPDFVLTRSKRGFGGPMGAWLRTDLRPLIAQVLAKDRLKREGVLNGDVVARVIAAHDAGNEDHTEAILACLVFELWRERFHVALP
ncbi:asparagine synthase (glutamine-hydrolyzing) [Nitrospira calida]|jgi:asparagine synthase (glutamine-hydrolysing)